MSGKLFKYLFSQTGHTKTGGRIGVEIETDFAREDGSPPTLEETQAILASDFSKPRWCSHKLETGRQKIELAISPQPNSSTLIEKTNIALQWLYGVAARYQLRPVHEPDFHWPGELFVATNARDRLWELIDGRLALEKLCRCSSVQFLIDVNPTDAVAVINRLWASGFHEVDYAVNHRRWLQYLSLSLEKHPALRYGGPSRFVDLEHYAHELSLLPVLMHKEKRVRVPVDVQPDLDFDLFLRSVWWHYRLRRFGTTLALEVRPISRRSDESLESQWHRTARAIGL